MVKREKEKYLEKKAKILEDCRLERRAQQDRMEKPSGKKPVCLL
jgi:hypothetical protein